MLGFAFLGGIRGTHCPLSHESLGPASGFFVSLSMLGGLLTKQAEEEERRLHEQLPRHRHHGLAGDVSAAVTAPATTCEDDVLDGEGSSAYDDADEDDDDEEEEEEEDIMGDASEDEDDDEIESYSEDDDDDDGSSAIDQHDNEDSYLLGGSEWNKQRRRRRRRHQGDEEQEKEQTNSFRYKTIIKNWKRTMNKLGSKIRLAVSAVADVDNVWDSPDDYSDQQHLRRHGGGDSRSANNILHTNNNNNNNNHYGTSNNNYNFNNHSDSSPDNRASSILCNIIAGGTTTRNRTAAIVWFILLSSSYAVERSSFKLLVDRVGPFRLFSAELILGSHALLTALGMAIGRMLLRNSKDKREINNHVLVSEMRKGIYGVFSGLPLADVACKFHFSTSLAFPSSDYLCPHYAATILHAISNGRT